MPCIYFNACHNNFESNLEKWGLDCNRDNRYIFFFPHLPYSSKTIKCIRELTASLFTLYLPYAVSCNIVYLNCIIKYYAIQKDQEMKMGYFARLAYIKIMKTRELFFILCAQNISVGTLYIIVILWNFMSLWLFKSMTSCTRV